ncbi:MAG: hypothetical protein ABI162_11705 [Luteolibacter sp.]
MKPKIDINSSTNNVGGLSNGFILPTTPKPTPAIQLRILATSACRVIPCRTAFDLMNQPPPMYRDQQMIDTDHLKLLSIFHFIGAGLAVLGLLFLFVHFTIMRNVFTNPHIWENSHQPASTMPPPEIFSFFKWFYLAAALWMIASCVLNLLSGLFLRAGKHRGFSIVVAGLNCLHMPLGTALGICTIVVLMRPSVQHRYDSRL